MDRIFSMKKFRKTLFRIGLFCSIGWLVYRLDAAGTIKPHGSEPTVAAQIELVVPPEKQQHLSAFMPAADDHLRLVMLAGDFEHIEINGADVTSSCDKSGGIADCRPERGWKAGLNIVKATLRNGTNDYQYVLYVSHYARHIPKTVWTDEGASIDGAPFFPMGIYNVSEKDMQKIAGYGFNLIQNYDRTSHDNATFEDNRRWFDAAEKSRLKVMWAISRKDAREQNLGEIAAWVASLMNHPALFCYYISDEPDLLGLSPENMEKVNLLVKGLDPFHPTTMSTWAPAKYCTGADMDMRQCYQGRPGAIARDFEKYLRDSRQRGLAAMAIVNTHDHPFGNEMRQKEPDDKFGNSPADFFGKAKPGTPEWKAGEERVKLLVANLDKPPFPFHSTFPAGPLFRSDAYAAIAKGSPGLFWWWYQDSAAFAADFDKVPADSYYTVFQHPETEKVVRRTIAELKSLSPLLMTPAIHSISWETNSILFWSRCTQGTNLIIAVNLSTNTVSGSFELKDWNGEMPRKAQVLGESRQVAIQKGALEDEWKPEDTHLYESPVQ